MIILRMHVVVILTTAPVTISRRLISRCMATRHTSHSRANAELSSARGISRKRILGAGRLKYSAKCIYYALAKSEEANQVKHAQKKTREP